MKTTAKKLLAAMLSALMVLSIVPVGCFGLIAQAEGRFSNSQIDLSENYVIHANESMTVEAYSRNNMITLVEFTPEQSAYYEFYSTGNDDTFGYVGVLDEGDFAYFAHNDDREEDSNFYIRIELEAGQTYYFGVAFYSQSSGTIDVTLEKEVSVESATFVPAAEKTVVEGVYDYGIPNYTDLSQYDGIYWANDNYWPMFGPGDKFDVTRDDGSTLEYTWSYNNVFAADEDDYIYAEWSHDQEEHPWQVDGEYNYFNVSAFGFTTQVPVTVLENTVASILYTPAEKFVFTVGMNGHPVREWITDENDNAMEVEWFHFDYDMVPMAGDTLTVDYTDFTSDSFEYTYDEDSGEWNFVNGSGEILPDRVKLYLEQSYEQQMTPDGDNYAFASYMGKTARIPVTVNANPVERIVYTQADPLVLFEGVSSGCWSREYIYNTDLGYHVLESYYRYNDLGPKAGDTLTVNYTDGSSDVFELIYDEYDNGFWQSANGETTYAADQFSHESYQSYSTRLIPGGEYNFFTFTAFGHTVEVPVIVKNLVESVTFVTENEKVLTEGVWQGECRTDGNGNEYYYYDTNVYNILSYGDQIIVTYNDGTEAETYTYTDRASTDEDWWDGEWYECWRNDADGSWANNNFFGYHGYEPGFYSDQENHPFAPDGEYNNFYFYFKNFKVEIPVTVQANPVESIAYTQANPLVLTEGISDGYWQTDWIMDEELDEEVEVSFYYYYNICPKAGDTLTLNYTNGSSEDFVLTYDEDGYGFWQSAISETTYAADQFSYSNNQSYRRRLTPGGEYNYFTFTAFGRSVNVPIIVKTNPI